MKTILVVDDAEFILESTSILLRFEGYDTHIAKDGLEALKKIDEVKPDLILCDILMPRLDGYGVLDYVRNNQQMANVPFLFLTAFSEKSNMRAAMEKGADDFLVKPFTRDELIAAIEAQWSKHIRIEEKVHQRVEEVSKNVTMALPHEFRTVLNEVINSAQYLITHTSTGVNEEIRDISEDIINSAYRLKKITENFLVFINIELLSEDPINKAKLQFQKCDEPSALLIDMAVVTSDRHNRYHDLTVGNMYHNASLAVSSENLYKIFDELLDNAFRFSNPNDKVEISSALMNNMIEFSISDSGIGMDKEHLKSISALSQFDRKIHEQQGIGLGLIISKKLVLLYGGQFNIESEKQKGTKVTFSLPLKK